MSTLNYIKFRYESPIGFILNVFFVRLHNSPGGRLCLYVNYEINYMVCSITFRGNACLETYKSQDRSAV